MRILLADDDERILRLISDYLKFDGYEVVTATNGEEALHLFKQEMFDLVILDVMMPIYDGWIVCGQIRKTSAVPILILTAKDSDLDELFGFEIGADDYISKPFNMELLLAHIKGLLRRAQPNVSQNKDEIKHGILSVNVAQHTVKVFDEVIELSPKEFDLLEYLIKNKERVVTRELLIEVIWNDEFFGETRTVDTHVTRLRSKLKEAAAYIKTVRGYGYKFEEEVL